MREKRKNALRSNGKAPTEVELTPGHPGIPTVPPPAPQRRNGGMNVVTVILVSATCFVGLILLYFIAGGW